MRIITIFGLLLISSGQLFGSWYNPFSWFSGDPEKTREAMQGARERAMNTKPGEEFEFGGRKVPAQDSSKYKTPQAQNEIFNQLPKKDQKRFKDLCQRSASDCDKLAAIASLYAGDGEFTADDFVQGFFLSSQIGDRTVRRGLTQMFRSDPKHLEMARQLIVAEMGANPDDPGPYKDYSGLSRRMGDFRGSVSAAQQGLLMDPNDAGLHSEMAQSLYELEDYESSFDSAKRALALDPSNKAAYSTMKLAQGNLGRGGGTEFFGVPQQAPPPSAPRPPGPGALAAVPVRAPASGMIDKRTKDASDKLFKSAYSRYQQRDYDSAIVTASKALEYNDSNGKALLVRSLALMNKGQYQEALRDIDQALALAPRNQAFLIAKANIFNNMGRFSDALAAARQAMDVNPNNPQALKQLAWALAGTGDRDGAVRALARAAQLDASMRPLYEAALDLPEDQDLTALFSGGAQAQGAMRSQHETRRPLSRFGLLALGVGGVFIGLFLYLWFSRREDEDIVYAQEEAAAAPGPEPSSSPPMAEGSVIGGTYRLAGHIGTGGMGIVYQAMDTSLERRVAVKKMRDEIRLDARERERFLSEAKTVAALRHQNIVEIYRIVEEGLDAFLVFEFVDGKTIGELLNDRRKLPFNEALWVLRGVCEALDYAHRRGIIHRDLKPSNIMVDVERRVKVMDFGVARAAKDSVSRLSMTNTVVGTPPYMAPEQEQGMVRKESDVYALAICFYEMVTGELPFKGVGAGMLMAKMNKTFIPPSVEASDLPKGFDAVLDKAFDPDPDKRYRTASELYNALAALVRG